MEAEALKLEPQARARLAELLPSDQSVPVWGYLTGLTLAAVVSDAAGRQRFRPSLLLRAILAAVFLLAAVPLRLVVGYIVGVLVVLGLALILGPDAVTSE